MDAAIRSYVAPAAIRLWIPLERKPLRVMDVLKLKVVVVMKTILCCPGGTNVVTLVSI
jgi:hypothetical protein